MGSFGEKFDWWAVRALVLAALVALAVVAVKVADDDEDDAPRPTSISATVRLAAGETRATVVVPGDLTATTQVLANVTTPTPAKSRVSVATVVKQPATDQFTVVLTRKAPAGGVSVDYRVSDLKGAATTEDDGLLPDIRWRGLMLLFIIAVGASFAAYWIAVNGRARASKPQDGAELAAFLKVSALITVAVIALVGVIITTRADDKNLSALFTLLGTIAGYLAGTKPSGGGETGGGGGDDGGDDGKGGGASAPSLGSRSIL